MNRSGYDAPGDQAERTSLAWSRTLLALAALVAFVSVHAAALDGILAFAVVGVLVAAALAASTSLVARGVWRRSVAALGGQERAARPMAVLSVSAACLVLAAISLSSITWASVR
jgi:uncharacterized membrane protein YidH (DUF202 family)